MLLKGFCFCFIFFSGEFDPERKRKREAGGSLSTEPLRREEREFLQEQKGKNIKIERVKGNGEIVHILGEKERDGVLNLTRVCVVIFISDGKLIFYSFFARNVRGGICSYALVPRVFPRVNFTLFSKGF